MLSRSFLLNLLLAITVVVLFGFIFFNSLNIITNHGEEIAVPKLKGKNLKDVIAALEDQDFKLRIDSTYKPNITPLQILDQEPEQGEMVKVGRTIFLIVNRAEPPKIEMPDLVGKSFRNAVLIMKSYRFVMGDTIYRPDIAAGAVLEQLYKGKKIATGTKIPYGSRIDLVVGEGLADYEVDMPNLIGKTWREAKEILSKAGLFHLLVFDGAITDTLAAIVYKQYPEALNELDFPNAIRGGDMVDIHIMQNPSSQLLRQNAPGSLKFQDLDDSLENVIQQRLQGANNVLSKAQKKTAQDTSGTADDGTLTRRKVDGRGKGVGAIVDDKNKGNKKPVVEDKNDQDFSNDYE